jgi:hypothetical protein
LGFDPHRPGGFAVLRRAGVAEAQSRHTSRYRVLKELTDPGLVKVEEREKIEHHVTERTRDLFNPSGKSALKRRPFVNVGSSV